MMNFKLQPITIRELVNGFKDDKEEGVVGYGGKLNIRPAYQREFVYKEKEKMAVIESVLKGFPLSVMYWIKNGNDSYELLDGQQRTLSICSYYCQEFFIINDGAYKGFENLAQEQKDSFLNYELQVYICENGTELERIEWFKVINIAGLKLKEQEILNAVYVGPWLMQAKLRFSKNGCVAYKLGNKFMEGDLDRQDYLERVLKWVSDRDGVKSISEYMAKHQFDDNSDREWQYFQEVIAWVERTFSKYRSVMKKVEWGYLYNRYKDIEVSSSQLEGEISRLIMDDDVRDKKGIYVYVLSKDERVLNIRTFSEAMKLAAYERQNGICNMCHNHFEIEEMEGDHITPWSEGGKTSEDNCQMLCKHCNRIKSNH